jgi:hypothetical protein
MWSPGRQCTWYDMNQHFVFDTPKMSILMYFSPHLLPTGRTTKLGFSIRTLCSPIKCKRIFGPPHNRVYEDTLSPYAPRQRRARHARRLNNNYRKPKGQTTGVRAHQLRRAPHPMPTETVCPFHETWISDPQTSTSWKTHCPERLVPDDQQGHAGC